MVWFLVAAVAALFVALGLLLDYSTNLEFEQLQKVED